ncbi:hypothetical protein T4D_12833 [Trichinella pseudospiralis]|uniref:Uncharacterized protein n=1 Tax=Trichinella pseudospiralis TaxID=6337 RepID=A0A0V1FMY6_TRIPS|nr:hypothetical protein T4D_12833 [Trichinella pseudospiralis]
MKVKRLSARFLCCNLNDSSVSSATDNSAARVWKLLRATPQCTQPVSIRNLRPRVAVVGLQAPLPVKSAPLGVADFTSRQALFAFTVVVCYQEITSASAVSNCRCKAADRGHSALAQVSLSKVNATKFVECVDLLPAFCLFHLFHFSKRSCFRSHERSSLKSSHGVRLLSAVPEFWVIEGGFSGHNAAREKKSESSKQHRIRLINSPPAMNSSHFFSILYRSTASLEKEMKPTVSPLINSLVTGSPSLVQENHIISRFMRLSFVFICYMAVTTKIVGSEREKLLQLSILSLQTHDVQRRSSSVPKNRSDECPYFSVVSCKQNASRYCNVDKVSQCQQRLLHDKPADCSRWRGDLSYYHKARECQALILIIKASLGVLDYSRVFVKAVNCVAQWPRLIAQLAIVFRMSCLFSVVLKTGVQ